MFLNFARQATADPVEGRMWQMTVGRWDFAKSRASGIYDIQLVQILGLMA